MTLGISSVLKFKTKKQGHTYLQWTASMLANMMVITYGLQFGWLSSVVRHLRSDNSPIGRPITNTEMAWIASLPCLISTFCASPFSWVVDGYGRKFGIMTIGVFETICWILKLPANPTCIILSYVFTGIAASGCWSIIPMYIKEISQDNMRGILGLTVIMSQNVGIFIVFLMGAYMDYYVVLYVLVSIPIITSALMMLAPESPVYLVKIGKVEKAKSTIANIMGLDENHKNVLSHLNNIITEDETFRSIPDVNFLSIFQVKQWRIGFVLMLAIMVVRGLNGGMAIMTYASIVLAQSGVTIRPELQSLSIPIFMIIGSVAAMPCIERYGRRPLLVSTSLISALTFAGLASVAIVQRAGGVVPGWVPVLIIVIGTFAFAAGVSPIPFIILTEMFNFQIRVKLIGILTGLTWLAAFVQVFAFPLFSATHGEHVPFLCYAVVNLLGIVVTAIWLPETKGKSIEEIEQALQGNKVENKEKCTRF